MDTGSIDTPESKSGNSWQLKSEYAGDTQALIVSAFAHLPSAAALFLELKEDAGGAWLRALREKIAITDATGRTEFSAAIAFTWTGLERMGLDKISLDGFTTPFKEGMHQPDRKRRLSDDNSQTLIEGGPLWSGGTSLTDPLPPTAIVVHAVLLLYAANEDALKDQWVAAELVLRENGVKISRERPLHLSMGKNADGISISREHFGFADGMSQPIPYGDAILSNKTQSSEEYKWHGVPAGEILIGHPNAHREPAPGPILEVGQNPSPRGDPNLLSDAGVSPGFRNLGLNGSYLVIRELRQYVSDFWKSMDDAAEKIDGARVDAEWLAERVIGRTLDGNPLAPDGPMPAEGPDVLANNFGYAEKDVHGLGCPLGSHIRRANPRDWLPSRDGPNPDLSPTSGLLKAVNHHRILRRARKFGPESTDKRIDDHAERGLLFMCLNTDIVRQFEFIQQTWLLNPDFSTLFKETDPLLGPQGNFTIPATPIRQCPEVKTYVKFAGGEYFFLPSIRALNYFSSLPPEPIS